VKQKERAEKLRSEIVTLLGIGEWAPHMVADRMYVIWKEHLWKAWGAESFEAMFYGIHGLHGKGVYRYLKLGKVRSKLALEDRRRWEKEIPFSRFRDLDFLLETGEGKEVTNIEEIVPKVERSALLSYSDHKTEVNEMRHKCVMPVDIGSPVWCDGIEGAIGSVREISLSADRESYTLVLTLDISVFRRSPTKLSFNNNGEHSREVELV